MKPGKNFTNLFTKQMRRQVLTGLGVSVIPYIFFKAIYKVEPGYQAVKFDIFRGIKNKVYYEGFHTAIPFVQRPLIFDCRMKNHVFALSAASKDLQTVQMKLRIISRPDTEHLPELYRLLGMNYDERVLHSIVFEIGGAIISQYNASQLINQRDIVSFLIKQKLTERSKEFFFELDDVALVRILNIIFRLISHLARSSQQQSSRNRLPSRRPKE
jgi:hypothetical protein